MRRLMLAGVLAAAAALLVGVPVAQAQEAMITAPVSGATVSGTVAVEVSASDPSGISGVIVYGCGGNVLGSDTTEPFSVPWDTAMCANGITFLTATAFVNGGGSIEAAAVQVTVDNRASPPGAGAPAAVVRLPDSVFLCYSKWQVVPGVWPLAQADSLLDQGYWKPYAVAGTMAGGVNTTDGAYHLDCNPDERGFAPSGHYVDSNGYRIPQDYEATYKILPTTFEIYGTS